ncbi:MAG: hypothetical protein KF901_21790 [Myxococcales bacterium]|nr:hypothetical protein [Myxococcales bacterium]
MGWRIFSDERGLSTTEYVILVVLIGAIGLLAWNLLGKSVEEKVVMASAQMGAVGAASDRGEGGARSAGGGGEDGPAPAEERPGREGAVASQGASGTSAMSGGREGVEVVGVVTRSGEGGMTVYSAPGADQDDSGFWITILGIVLAFFGLIAFFARVKGRAAR